MVMSFDPSEQIVAIIMQELIIASKRKVHVLLNIDAHSLMIHDVTALPTGPLFIRYNPVPVWRRDFNAKQNILTRLSDSGGLYRITNMPEKRLHNPFSGRSHMKFTVINDTAYIGGCNLNKTWGIDLMVRMQDQKTVEWIYNFIYAAGLQTVVASALYNKDVRLPVDHATTLIVDAGLKGESLIYKEALKLIDQAKEWIILTCQFFPGKATAEHVVSARKRGVKVTIYFDPLTSRATIMRLPHWFAERQERNKYPSDLFKNRLPAGMPRLHAKLLATEQAAMIGSHNYLAQGVSFGTAEATILRREPHFAKEAVKIFKNRLAEVTDN
jgi:phosphatidylserine/phosphatidylglycerophosphate/cardiolipin synthase-like enzyme